MSAPPNVEAGTTDRQLLERFAGQRDEAAFAALMKRHGPMVLGVCRRILQHAHDAEDAFQATFLVLVRKAGGIARGERLSNWLYGVAVRTASKLKVQQTRRRVHEQACASQKTVATAARALELDVRPTLDEEIQQLPRKYRTPVLLCYLEGKTNQEAAAELGCPPGTVSSRLAWARQRLRRRLARRGIALAAGVAGAGIDPAAAMTVPVGLTETTVRLGMEFLAGKLTAAGAASLRVGALTQEVLSAMFWARCTGIAAVGMLVLSVIGAGAGAWAYGTRPAGGTDGSQVASPKTEPDDPVKLREEIARLQQEINRMQRRLAALQAKLEAQGRPAEAVMFRGKGKDFWIEALKDRDPKYRRDAVDALGAIAEVDRTVIPFLIACLKDTQAGGFNAAGLLGHLGEPALPALRDAMKDGDEFTRRTAAYALGMIGPKAVPVLADGLKDGQIRVVAVAIRSLLEIGRKDEAAVRVVQSAIKDKDVKLRRRIIEGIATITGDRDMTPYRDSAPPPPNIYTILIEGAHDPELEIRNVAIAGLGSLRFRDRELSAALVKVVTDAKEDKSLRKAAFDALKRLDPRAAAIVTERGDP
jgi:RNA polymerase sigma factor (sigma-70 family)